VPPWVVADDNDEIPSFGNPWRAAITAVGLEATDVFDQVRVLPAWASGVTDTVLRRRFGITMPPPDFTAEEREALAREVAASVYLVEARCRTAQEADTYAADLPRRILIGLDQRSAA